MFDNTQSDYYYYYIGHQDQSHNHVYTYTSRGAPVSYQQPITRSAISHFLLFTRDVTVGQLMSDIFVSYFLRKRVIYATGNLHIIREKEDKKGGC